MDARSSRSDYMLDPSTGCWKWQKTVSKSGYGTKTFQRKGYYAHRFYYEKFKGVIPAGMCIDHLCRNKSCVNPDHLEAVPQKENVRRGKTTKITQFTVDCIRRLWRSGVSVSKLAKYFDLSRSWTFIIVTNRKRAT